jgi:hypothetical protein
MRLTEAHLADLRTRGFIIVEGFADPAELKAAQDALWTLFPTPEAYFADPAVHAKFAKSQFAGIKLFPYNTPAIDALVTNPDLIDAAERFLGTDDLEIYKVELWAKYAGAIDYDQAMHRDYGNHTIVTPDTDLPPVQMTTFMLLSDVGPDDGPTHIVPVEHTTDIAITPMLLGDTSLHDKAVPFTGPAGTILIYSPHVFHRGTNFRRPDASRFVISVDFNARGAPWRGKMSWPDRALYPGWTAALAAMSPRARCLFGFPAPGDAYWTPRTLADVGARYPAMDMTPYR